MRLIRKSRTMHVEIYRAQHSAPGQAWSWRVRGANNRIVASAGERFWNKTDVAVIVGELFPHLPVKVLS